jgi:DNA-binding NarL/FixJ family response regulator
VAVGRILIADDHPLINDGIQRGLRAVGGAGFLSKRQPLDDIVKVLATILQGGSVFPVAAETSDDLAVFRKLGVTIAPRPSS